jgi:hypothetical protein
MSDIQSHAESGVYKQQGFGTSLPMQGNIGLLIVDFVVGFAAPKTFGGGNIAPAIERTVHLLAAARRARNLTDTLHRQPHQRPVFHELSALCRRADDAGGIAGRRTARWTALG